MQPKEPKEKKPINVKIGRRIKQARRKKSLTQDKLASQVGISSKHLSALETGICAPSYETLARLSSTLDTSADYFLMDEPDINPKYSLNPEMEKRARKMTPATQLACLAMMDQLLLVQDQSLEVGGTAHETDKSY